MSFTRPFRLRNVRGVPDRDKEEIAVFLQGVVYSWLKNRRNEIFAARDLVGGVNFNWEGTPLFKLYLKHSAKGSGAVKAAGKDLGWILMAALADDRRTFEKGRKGRTNGYRWIGNEA